MNLRFKLIDTLKKKFLVSYNIFNCLVRRMKSNFYAQKWMREVRLDNIFKKIANSVQKDQPVKIDSIGLIRTPYNDLMIDENRIQKTETVITAINIL